MQPIRTSCELIEWRSKSHLNLWLERSRNRRPLTRKASTYRGSLPQTSVARVGDFGCRIRGGLGAISAAAPANSPAGTRSFSRFRKVAAPGLGHSFVRTSASVSALSSRCGRGVTIYPGFRELCSLTICSSTVLKVIGGIDFEANIWFREASLAGQKSFYSRAIRGIVSFLCICS